MKMSTASINYYFHNFVLVIIVFRIIAIGAISNTTESAPAANITVKTWKSENTPIKENTVVSLEQVPTIDIASCKCVATDEDCQVSVAKSITMEISCPDNHHYCCNAHQPNKTALKQGERDGLRIKIYFPTALPIGTAGDKNESTTDIKSDHLSNSGLTQSPMMLKKAKAKLLCRCKPRVKCQEKYMDYRFSFDCTYDTVRCCEPEYDILKEKEVALIESGKVILAGSNEKDEKFWMNNNKLNGGGEGCYCLPLNRCKINPNLIEKRKDTLCPYDLVQCCGDLIDRDEEEKSTVDEPSNRKSHDSKEFKARVGTGMNINVGQPAFRHPIQLPLLKIPTRNEEEAFIEGLIATSTLPPPSLPNYYYYKSPNDHNGHYSPPSHYQYRSDYPWSGLSHVSPYSNDYSNNRHVQLQRQPVPNPYESSRSAGGSLTILETIAGFFGKLGKQ